MRSPFIPAHRGIYLVGFAFAFTWIALGFNSDNVPWGTSEFWLVMCSFAAGAALAVAHYRTLFAMRSYVAAVVGIGWLRSIAYLSTDNGGPAAVWALVAMTTALAYALALHYRRT